MFCIVLCSNVLPPLLTPWKDKIGAEIILSDNGKIGAAFDHLPESSDGNPVVVVDYPLDTSADIDALEAFCRWVQENPGQWYYAPRPNAYLAVTHSAMAGVHRWKRKDEYRGLLDKLRAIYGKCPSFLRPMLRWLGSPIVARLRKQPSEATALTSSDELVEESERVVETGPQVQVPQDVQALGGEWQEWDAPASSVHRDLLERADHFFPHPKGIHVIVLNKCNLECVMCPYHSPVYKPTHKTDYFDSYKSMSPEVFSKIADYAGEHKIALQFGQIEEPLMHKGIVKFLQEAHNKGVPNIHMTTNGILLTKDKTDALVESGLTSLMVSLDAENPDTYKEIRGADLEEVEENLKYFISKAKPRGIKVWVSFIMQPQAKSEREEFFAKWRKMGVDRITYYALGTHDLDTGEIVGFEHMYDRDAKRYPCASPWTQSVVFPDGEVSLCCRTMGLIGWTGVVDVGTLTTEPDFGAIWKGQQYEIVRKELLENKFDQYKICQDCTIWSASTTLTEEGEGYIRSYNETMETFEFN